MAQVFSWTLNDESAIAMYGLAKKTELARTFGALFTFIWEARMDYVVEHNLVDSRPHISVRRVGETATVSVSESGSFAVLAPGKLLVVSGASYTVIRRVHLPEGGGGTNHGEWVTSRQHTVLGLTFELRDPAGDRFTRDEITLKDMARFRDVRGSTVGNWTWTLRGQSPPISLHSFEEGDNPRVESDDNGQLHVKIDETISSKSPWPYVDAKVGAAEAEHHKIDLYRVGTFVAFARNQSIAFLQEIVRGLRLRDPDGKIVAESLTGELRFPVTLPVIERSRAADGSPLLWDLEVLPGSAGGPSNRPRVWASVIEYGRTKIGPLQSRIDDLLGPDGSKLKIWGVNKGDRLQCRLRIEDLFTAETLDMHSLLDDRIKAHESLQDPGYIPKDLQPNVDYVIADQDSVLHTFSFDSPITPHFSIKVHAELDDVRITRINVALGPSVQIQPSVPSIRVTIGVSGEVKIKVGAATIGSAKVRNGALSFEAGLGIEAGGFKFLHWINDDPLDIDLDSIAVAAAGLLNPLLAVTVVGISELIEEKINTIVKDGFAKVIDGSLSAVPGVVRMILGAQYTYRSLKVQDGAFVLEYLAPDEPVKRPKGMWYEGVVGRSFDAESIIGWQFHPRSLKTWEAENLKNIDHIVMVMMENRSFDHVLGYLAKNGADSDGLTPELIQFLSEQEPAGTYVAGPLNQTAIPLNYYGKKTQFPLKVSHALSAVTEQLGTTADLDLPGWGRVKFNTFDFNSRKIISPAGFYENFKKEKHDPAEVGGVESGVDPKDVMGYYDGQDLPFFKYLIENYSYCERYFCSHAGPTLPNRMFSLIGDLQRDGNGEPIADNNDRNNFVLSRDHTIFDLLSRKGVSWRVYESYPSVTMLRMFARYATNTTDILPLSRLANDVARGDVPSFTVVEPQMHAFPEDDDHPPSDMYRGQRFLQKVYDIFRNSAVWERTLMIITYDEHGGFYDHVVPPIADGYIREMVNAPEGPTSAGPITPNQQLVPYGVRVPTFVVSPWVMPGKGPDKVLDHCSILKTVISRFLGEEKTFLSDRVHAAQSFDSFLTAPAARMDVPPCENIPEIPGDETAPTGRRIITQPMSRRKMRSGDADYHDFSGMVARMLGRDTPDPIA